MKSSLTYKEEDLDPRHIRPFFSTDIVFLKLRLNINEMHAFITLICYQPSRHLNHFFQSILFDYRFLRQKIIQIIQLNYKKF